MKILRTFSWLFVWSVGGSTIQSMMDGKPIYIPVWLFVTYGLALAIICPIWTEFKGNDPR